MAALRKTLAHRLSRIVSPPAYGRRLSGEDSGLLRRFFQKGPLFRPAIPPDRSPPAAFLDCRLADRIRDLSPARVRLDCLSPPAPASEEKMSITVEEARKLLRATQLEAARARLRAAAASRVPYSEFVRMCCEAVGSESGLAVARSLDESGCVIVLGKTVFLRPEMEIKERVF